MLAEFSSSIVRGGNVLTPERIIVSDDSVEWKKRNKFLIGYDSKTIPISRIATINIDQGIIGCNITITSTGADMIVGKNFTKADSNEIKRLIEKQLKALA